MFHSKKRLLPVTSLPVSGPKIVAYNQILDFLYPKTGMQAKRFGFRFAGVTGKPVTGNR
jgi:hypothetical protein